MALPPSSPGPGSGDATASTTGTPEQAGAPTEATRVEPAPHPRHRALPDPGRDARWNAFANARRAAPVVPDAGQAGGQDTDPDAMGPAETREPGGGMLKFRRGLFRRNRAKDGGPVETGRGDHETEPLAEQDEEYVDWVAGLASDADGERIRTRRTGRHHRD
ncbi:hypothetical protein ABZ570_18695 [Micromonospora sp. NPDC007271]|uniref:hypothetical protein n=1 Tax=Micromonospora sp. NPDC007271 TaxID=3154587 RepID=UPI0033DBFF28